MADPSFLTGARLAIVTESSPGTLSGTATWNVVPLLTEGFSINPQKNFIDADVVDATRQKTNAVAGASSVRVTLTTEVNNEPAFRLLLESACFSTFSTDTIVTGATRKTFSIEFKNELGATDYYRRVAGCVVDSVTFTAPEQGFVKATWNILGIAYSTATAEIGDTYTAVSGYSGMASTLTGTSIAYNGGALPGVTDLSFSISNGLIAMYAQGSTAADHLTQGNTKIEGSGAYYLRNNTVTTPFISEAVDDLVLVWKSADASPIKQTLTTTFPAMQFTAAEVAPTQLTMSDKFQFKANYGSGISSKIQMVFTAA